jgi:hypothetical protein
MNGFILLKHSCPVCNGARKDCRQSNTTNLIFCRDSNTNPLNYIFRGFDTHGFGMWAERTEAEAYSEEQRQEWQRQRELAHQQRLEVERQQRAQGLSESERDHECTLVFNQLSLNQRHREDLERRGLSDELIKVGGFKSVEQWQRLNIDVNHRLAGVSINGRSLITQAGYIWPIKNPKGQILAWQLRLDEASEGGRFRWPTSATKKRANGPTAHLLNGELPIACHRPTGQPLTDAIELTEGTGVKPFITAIGLNRITLGAAGGNFGASQETFKSYLDELSAELETKQLILSPDAGAVANPHVMAAYQTTYELISQWGYKLKFRWWNQVSQEADDIDELGNPQELVNYLSPEEFFALNKLTHQATRLGRRFLNWKKATRRTIPRDEWEIKFGLGKWLKSKIEQLLGKKTTEVVKSPKDSSLAPLKFINYTPGQLPTPQEYQQQGNPCIRFQDGQRLQLIQELVEKGYHDILDSSQPGLGKSHDAGIVSAEKFKSDRVWLFSQTHRNPTTAPVEANYMDMPVRNDGMVIDYCRRTPLNNPHVRWPKRGEKPDTSGNCFRTDIFKALQEKGYKAADLTAEQNPICQNCHVSWACRNGSGSGYGFRYERKEAFEAKQVRLSPDSASSPEEYPYQEDGAFWDEAMTILKPVENVCASLQDFDSTWAEIEDKLPDVHRELKLLRLALRTLLAGEIKQDSATRYGWNDTALRALLPPSPDKISNMIDQLRILSPDMESILEKPDTLDSRDLKGVSKSALSVARRGLRQEAYQKSLEKVQALASNWLILFLEVWGKLRLGAVRVNGGVLTVWTRSVRHAHLAEAMKWNCYQDATANRKYLALYLGINPESIVQIEQEPKATNKLKVVQVQDLGLLGNSRSASQQQRVKALKAELISRHPDIGIIEHKNQASDGSGWWFNHNRGSNEYKDRSALGSFGTPYQNIGALQDWYLTLTGERNVSRDAPGFCEYVRWLTDAEFIQAVGRLRAHLRPEEQLTYYAVTSYELPQELNAQIVPAFAITPLASTAVQLVRWKILEAVRQLTESGVAITSMRQEAVANKSGLTQSRISQIATEFGGWKVVKKILTALLTPINRDANNLEPLDADLTWLAQTYLPLVLEAPTTAIKEVGITVRVYGSKIMMRILSGTSLETQVKLLALILEATRQGVPQKIDEVATG